VFWFGATLQTALILGLAFAHVMELPGKPRLNGPTWLTVQQNLYVGFGPLAAVAEPLGILLTWVLTPFGLAVLPLLGEMLAIRNGRRDGRRGV
jgi:hypothetical protein